jgi:hypothetical protein
MFRIKPSTVLLPCALFIGALAPSALADAWNKKTIVDFPNAVEVPGTILQPGKYVMKLVDSNSNRHIVQISNAREDHVFATILAIPNYRLEPRGKTVLTFYEIRGGGQPEPLKAWFYPGDNFGQEFAYSKRRAREIAMASRQSVTSESGTVSAAAETTVAQRTVEPTPEPVPTPEETPVAVEQRTETQTTAALTKAEESPMAIEEEPEQAPAPAPSAPTPEAQPSAAPQSQMPATASPVPLVALTGLSSLIAALGVRTLRQKWF